MLHNIKLCIDTRSNFEIISSKLNVFSMQYTTSRIINFYQVEISIVRNYKCPRLLIWLQRIHILYLIHIENKKLGQIESYIGLSNRNYFVCVQYIIYYSIIYLT